MIGIASAVQIDERVPKAGFRLRCPDGADRSFAYERVVHGSPECAAGLNERLADRIAARPGLFEDPGLRFVAVFRSV